MSHRAAAVFIGFLTVAVPAWADSAPERWADAALPVKDGLVLWLDAGRLNDARRANGGKDLLAGDKVDCWYDAAGAGRQLTQKNAAAQPTFLAGETPALLFDGDASYLSLTGAGLSFKDATVIVVAAPFGNPGDFRAFLAMNQSGKNDYTTGLNLDLGPAAGPRFSTVNVEGPGFGGWSNLLRDASDFGAVRRLAVVASPGPGGVRLYADGKPNGRRDRAAGTIRMDDFWLGARCYNNEGGAANVRGFLSCAILQVLVYDRALSDDELKKLDDYLAGRLGKTTKIAPPRGALAGKPLIPVADPPPVQVLVPGFVVKQLPLDLPNINNVRYRPDGKLMALAYNGDIYQLSDSKKTGVEDKAELFWESKGALRGPIGMALTPPGYARGDGVFVASKGKLSLIVDTDGDGKADKEIIVADGWKELSHGVDALGVAIDKYGNIYFGLGCADYTNPYLIDKSGQSHYDLKSERGTILKVWPDFSRREIICTGVRFTVGLAFNRDGELFATDQEGATWLANGNPFDELLHIEPIRHYGFPPRHPKHLPDVIDEPSVFDYGPQHQSTCGLVFDEPVNKGPVFGPEWWAGDALLTGYSRGKLYRTKLARTPAGYVGRTDLLACLGMLAVDACVSPTGDLVVACHGGDPDWGNGPSGHGKLYKISYVGKGTPQPVLAWAAGPHEVRVAFDAPLEPNQLKDLARWASIEYGKYIRPGDRFEVKRPGYEAVRRQLATPRFDLPVRAVGVSGDRRTLILTTDAMPEAVSYALTLDGFGRPDKPGLGELPQHPCVDIGYDLCGVEASWRAKDGDGAWDGWLPHLDLSVCRALTAGSAEHDRLWELMRQPGTLTLRTKLDLWQMLRPAVQVGSTLDYTLPYENVILTLRSSQALEVTAPDASLSIKIHIDHTEERYLTTYVHSRPRRPEPLDMTFVLLTGATTALDISYSTNEDERPRALPLNRFLLPWAVLERPKEAQLDADRDIPELKGGDWAHGRDAFFSEQAQCAKCHQVHGRGGKIGPDLSNLIHRDYESVLRDIRFPSATIHPDYLTYLVELKDGRALSGAARTEGEELVIGDLMGREIRVKRSDVDALHPSAKSIMPEGLEKAVGPERMRDLLTFLLTEPLKPAPLERDGAPPPRKRAEVDAVLKDSAPPAADARKLHIVLAAGKKDHGVNEHDYPLWQKRWTTLLSLADGVTVETADGWPSAAQWGKADVVVMYSSNPGWTADKVKDLDAFFDRGGGLVLIHWGVNGGEAPEEYAACVGLAWGKAARFRHGKQELTFTRSKNPITRNFDKLELDDESYWNLTGELGRVDVLATGDEEGKPQPLFWTHEQGKGRVFVAIPGHFTWTFDDPLYRILLLRGIAWSAGETVDRFNELATIGARMGD
ncbi:MAG TPA: ThuA domain-containing protein [Gemmataceae bacterium]|nr:ThuA domain-containing protein [Gemmataceae bacterium]